MAERAVVRGVDVKLRHPWGVFFLAIITFGIYYVVWYYKINRELGDYGRAVGADGRLDVNPWLSVLAITLGAFVIVPPFVSWWRTLKRIQAAQELSGVTETVSVGLGFVLYLIALFFFPIELIYSQSHLNRLWRHGRTS